MCRAQAINALVLARLTAMKSHTRKFAQVLTKGEGR
jgi:hypothetical protein